MNYGAVFFALLSAALFGASTPAAKSLLGTVHPAILAGLLYCGAGIGIAIVRRIARVSGVSAPKEAALRKGDARWLAGAIVSGGIAGPLLLMIGLSRTEATTASLLLTLEGVATALLAWFVFRENFDRRIAAGMALLVLGAIVLAWSGQPTFSSLAGPAAIAGACLAWGLDNNLTRNVSLADPLQIVEWKGLVAGPANLLIGLWAGGVLPTPEAMAFAGLVGFLGYGVSLALFVVALRHLGTARTGAYFSTAPFIGAVAAIVILREPLTFQIVFAGVLMAAGLWFHLTEHHEHAHEHHPLDHNHAHIHDEHHRHAHGPDDPLGEPHSHAHSHALMQHAHPHTPDMHHTHRH